MSSTNRSQRLPLPGHTQHIHTVVAAGALAAVLAAAAIPRHPFWLLTILALAICAFGATLLRLRNGCVIIEPAAIVKKGAFTKERIPRIRILEVYRDGPSCAGTSATSFPPKECYVLLKNGMRIPIVQIHQSRSGTASITVDREIEVLTRELRHWLHAA